MDTKVCSKCGGEKELSEFHKDKRSKDGRRSACAECINVFTKDYYIKNREKLLEGKKSYYWRNRTSLIEKNKNWRHENREHCLSYRKEYYKQNIEFIKELQKKWRNENKEHMLIQQKKYREQNKGEIKKRTKQWRERNKEYLSIKKREYWSIKRNEYLNSLGYAKQVIRSAFAEKSINVYKDDIPDQIARTKLISLQIKRELRND